MIPDPEDAEAQRRRMMRRPPSDPAVLAAEIRPSFAMCDHDSRNLVLEDCFGCGWREAFSAVLAAGWCSPAQVEAAREQERERIAALIEAERDRIAPAFHRKPIPETQVSRRDGMTTAARLVREVPNA